MEFAEKFSDAVFFLVELKKSLWGFAPYLGLVWAPLVVAMEVCHRGNHPGRRGVVNINYS